MFASTTFLAIASNLLIADGATTLQELKISDADSSVPESCKHRVFCLVKPDDYPQETIDYIVDDRKALLQPAPQDELTQQLLFVNDEGYDMIHCPSEVTFEPIYKVKQQNGAWRTVVQSRDYDFVQRYRLEACTNPGRSCFVGNNPMEIDTSCRQKFTTMDLVVMKGYNDTETISVQLPSQCGCYMSQSVVNS